MRGLLFQQAMSAFQDLSCPTALPIIHLQHPSLWYQRVFPSFNGSVEQLIANLDVANGAFTATTSDYGWAKALYDGKAIEITGSDLNRASLNALQTRYGRQDPLAPTQITRINRPVAEAAGFAQPNFEIHLLVDPDVEDRIYSLCALANLPAAYAALGCYTITKDVVTIARPLHACHKNLLMTLSSYMYQTTTDFYLHYNVYGQNPEYIKWPIIKAQVFEGANQPSATIIYDEHTIVDALPATALRCPPITFTGLCAHLRKPDCKVRSGPALDLIVPSATNTGQQFTHEALTSIDPSNHLLFIPLQNQRAKTHDPRWNRPFETATADLTRTLKAIAAPRESIPSLEGTGRIILNDKCWPNTLYLEKKTYYAGVAHAMMWCYSRGKRQGRGQVGISTGEIRHGPDKQSIIKTPTQVFHLLMTCAPAYIGQVASLRSMLYEVKRTRSFTAENANAEKTPANVYEGPPHKIAMPRSDSGVFNNDKWFYEVYANAL